MQSHGSILIVLMAPLMVAWGCAAASPSGESTEGGPLLASLEVTTGGGTVELVLQVTNTSEEPVELNFRSGQSYDFVVLDGEREVWRWSDDRMFTQALRRERLDPGESRKFEAQWRPASSLQGELVARGIVTAADHRVEQATRFRLP